MEPVQFGITISDLIWVNVRSVGTKDGTDAKFHLQYLNRDIVFP